MKKKLKLAKKGLIILTSVVCTVLFFWFLILGKIKAKELLNPFIELFRSRIGRIERR